ncbi:MAG TPA: hypothetical protein VFU40_07130 [Gemmatimonadales bacterium]|nr:hypothetical protein [Gemmatimonadales bacterium]
MPSRSFAVLPAVLAMTSLAGASMLHAQAASTARFHEGPHVVAAPISRAIHCGPAPLTERPGIAWEFSRPRTAPLEAAFAEAARVKRAVATHRMHNRR